jgi:hypothetical protein
MMDDGFVSVNLVLTAQLHPVLVTRVTKGSSRTITRMPHAPMHGRLEDHPNKVLQTLFVMEVADNG